MRRERCGITAVELIVVSLLFMIVAVVAGYLLIEAQKRSRVARTRSEMRKLAVAIETYFADVAEYPAWGIGHRGPGAIRTLNWDVAQRTGNRSGVGDLPSFLLNDDSRSAGVFQTLTTPLAYVGYVEYPQMPTLRNSYPVDRFCPDRGATFVYWTVWPNQPGPNGKILSHWPLQYPGDNRFGWMLVSPGPDGDYDLAGSYDLYGPATTQPSTLLLAGTNAKGSSFTYDATNGLVSDGDIWRISPHF